MRTYFRGREWRYWAGTVEDLLNPAERAVAYIAEHTKEDVRFDATVTLPDQQIDAESITELRESIRDHDVPDIDSITIKIGSRETLRLDLDVRRSFGAVRLRTRGTDEMAVNGLHTTIASELDRGRRVSYGRVLALRIALGLFIGVVLPILIFASGLITINHTGEFRYAPGDGLFTPAGRYEVTDWEGPWWAFVSLFALPFLGIAIVGWGHTIAIKDLELLRPGEITLYLRVRRIVWGAIALLVIGPLAGIAWSAFVASQ